MSCKPRGTALQVEGDGHLVSAGVLEGHLDHDVLTVLALVLPQDLLELLPVLEVDEDGGDGHLVACISPLVP